MNNSNFKTANLKEIADSLSNYKTFVLCGHRNPDGDSVGSCNCLKYALEQLNKTVYIYDEGFELNIDNSYCFIQMDVQAEYRIEKRALQIKNNASFTICIDHHQKEDLNCNLVYIDSTASANSLNVWDLVNIMPVKVNVDIAEAAYYGLCSDTNSFTNTNSDLRSFNEATKMLTYGVDVAKIAQELFQSRTLASFKLEKITLQNMYVDKNNKFVLSYIEADDFIKCNAQKSDSDYSINLLRTLEYADVACVIRQQKNGEKIHGSLRSKNNIDVTLLAKKHIGGGHQAAAGFTMDETNMQDAIKIVKSQLKDLMQGKI